jgi:hypothetical protein
MIQIDREKAIALLEQAVEPRPSFIYQQTPKNMVTAERGPMHGCWYEKGGAPSCGVGVALSIAGVPLTVLDEMDQVEGDTSIESVLHVLVRHDISLTDQALQVFSRFQTRQDDGFTWAEALSAAKKEGI